LVIERHFPDERAECRPHVVFACGYRRGRRFLIDLFVDCPNIALRALCDFGRNVPIRPF
jgi:hypothetical protein